jgi:hypothetical protein
MLSAVNSIVRSAPNLPQPCSCCARLQAENTQLLAAHRQLTADPLKTTMVNFHKNSELPECQAAEGEVR